ncbi:MAG: hypothetical protein E7256_10335 [Lachnospiraceae bacterium]|nr:hypothetical protein [Lachnospiraceae bacterium]
MILVDIGVPSLGQNYNFSLDENAIISNLLEEISEMIVQKEKCEGALEGKKFMLCSMEREEILRENRTLRSYEIENGSRLLFV